MEIKDLISRAKSAKKRAYAPYSGFRVGAALLTREGKVYTGCNIELSSYSLTICAERVALFKAISEGEREFEAMVVLSDSETLCPPCGPCRQVMWEFGGDMKVILANPKGEYITTSVRDLLPEAFDKGFLEV